MGVHVYMYVHVHVHVYVFANVNAHVCTLYAHAILYLYIVHLCSTFKLQELRIKLRGGMQQLASGSADSSRSRPPMIMKSQTMGGAPKSQADNRV